MEAMESNVEYPARGERKLLALSVDKVKTPAGLVLNKPSFWSGDFSGYDLVMISHRDFIEGVKSLKQHRNHRAYQWPLLTWRMFMMSLALG